MAADNSRECLDVLLNLIDVDADRDGLEEDSGSSLAERNCGTENDDGNDERDGRVSIEAPGVVGEPDEESGGNDSDVS